MDLTIAVGADPSAAFAALGCEVEAEPAGVDQWHLRLYGAVSPGDAIAATDRAGGQVVDLRRIEGTLEDVFVHLTGRDLR